MTVIKPNSISGINSITAKTNEAVSFYESDGSSGNVIAGVVTATTFDGNVTGNLSGDIVGTRTLGTGVTVTAAGIVSATNYYGSAQHLTSIPGANIIVVGSEIGTASDEEGSYTIESLEIGSELSVSAIGYEDLNQFFTNFSFNFIPPRLQFLIYQLRH